MSQGKTLKPYTKEGQNLVIWKSVFHIKDLFLFKILRYSIRNEDVWLVEWTLSNVVYVANVFTKSIDHLAKQGYIYIYIIRTFKDTISLYQMLSIY